MPTSTLSDVPTFDSISELEDACLRVAIVRSALELGVFDAIAEADGGGASAGELANRFGANERALGILLDALCAQGFLHSSDERYRLDETAATYLVSRSESYYGGSCLELTLSFEAAGNLTQTVRSGRPVDRSDSGQGSPQLWAADLAPYLALWPVKAERARHLWRRLDIGWDTRPLRILEVACGAAIPALTLLQANPNAHAVCADLHLEVLDVARQISRRMGVENRVEFRRVDILEDDFGAEAFDLVFCGAVLYFFDAHRVVDILRRARAAVKPGGRVVIHHLMSKDGLQHRPGPALLAVQLLLFHPRSRVYTAVEYQAMLIAAGLHDPQSDEDLAWAIR